MRILCLRNKNPGYNQTYEYLMVAWRTIPSCSNSFRMVDWLQFIYISSHGIHMARASFSQQAGFKAWHHLEHRLLRTLMENGKHFILCHLPFRSPSQLEPLHSLCFKNGAAPHSSSAGKLRWQRKKVNEHFAIR